MEDLNTPEMIAADLAALKEKADTLGVQYHPSIGADKLREKIAAHTNPAPAVEAPSAIPKPVPQPFNAVDISKSAEAAPDVIVDPVPVVIVPETVTQKRTRLKAEALKLVRVRVTCMNPAKKEWEGEILTCGNGLIGTVAKYIPFNAEEGWHIPQILFNMLKERRCQIFAEGRDAKGNKIRQGKMIREFNIEVLDELTEDELKELAARQAATRAID